MAPNCLFQKWKHFLCYSVNYLLLLKQLLCQDLPRKGKLAALQARDKLLPPSEAKELPVETDDRHILTIIS